MTAYYNEIDPYAAQWLRNLIDAGHIADGVVDERSIEDVHPDDLRGFTQCHFFAGIGVWSYALRLAGWADDRPVWTGSCPCQPFSAAGKGAGFDDQRHLWPHFHHLIKECRPSIVIGEQVASKDADPWIDLVQDDLEALGYAVGAVPFPAAGVGAPHIRDRLYWVANADQRQRGQRRAGPVKADWAYGESAGCSPACLLGDAGDERLAQRKRFPGVLGGTLGADAGQTAERAGVHVGGLADADGNRCEPGSEGCQAVGHGQATGADCGACRVADDLMQQRPHGQPGISHVDDAGRWLESAAAPAGLCDDLRPGPVNGFWRAADWLGCRDDKWRPVEPGTFPLAHGAPARVGRLRAYGNAINAEAARCFIECVMEAA